MRIIDDLLGFLNGTGLFVDLDIKGGLEHEWDKLIVQYKKSPSIDEKRFQGLRKVLGGKLRKTIEVNYPCVEVNCSLMPGGIYTIELKRLPLEGSWEDLADRLINDVYSDVNRTYWN